MFKPFTGIAFSIVAAASLHADVAQYWPDWLASGGYGELQGKIVREILGPLRPYPLDTTRLIRRIGNATDTQLGGWRVPEGDIKTYFGFIAWNFNSYTILNPRQTSEEIRSGDEWIQASLWPFGQPEVHEQIMRYLSDNGIKPSIQYFTPLGMTKNGGTVFQWTEDSSPKVVVRVYEIAGIQTTISFFSEEDFRKVDFRLLERPLVVGEIPLVQPQAITK